MRKCASSQLPFCCPSYYVYWGNFSFIFFLYLKLTLGQHHYCEDHLALGNIRTFNPTEEHLDHFNRFLNHTHLCSFLFLCRDICSKKNSVSCKWNFPIMFLLKSTKLTLPGQHNKCDCLVLFLPSLYWYI